jgi:hypothetical protein
VYDKLSTEAEMIVGTSSAVASKSSRTMLVAIKFDIDKKIETVKYRQTSY